MKNYFSLILCLCTSFCLQAQIEFAPLGATYYYHWDLQPFNEGPFVPVVKTIEVASDTTINGQACRKLIGGSRMIWSCGDTDDHAAYVYEEEGRVYNYSRNTSNFELLYDFNKGVGETWEVLPYCADSGVDDEFLMDTLIFTVDSISYVEMNGMSIKVQHVLWTTPNVTWSSPLQIYEGIGNIGLLFFTTEYSNFTFHDYYRSLRCFYSPVDGTFSFYEDAGECDMIVGVESLDNTLPFKVYPNPVFSELNVQGDGHFDLQLLNLNGQLIDHQNNRYEQVSINLTAYPAGIYYVKIKQADKFKIEKIVKY